MRLLYCACYPTSIFADPLQMSHPCHGFVKRPQAPQVFLCTFDKVQCRTRSAPHKTALQSPKAVRTCGVFTMLTWQCRNSQHFSSTSEPPKVVRSYGAHAFTILTWQCALRLKGGQFLNSSTSKSAPRWRCFAHFKLGMRVAPQHRALLEHLNFQKCSEPEVILT